MLIHYLVKQQQKRLNLLIEQSKLQQEILLLRQQQLKEHSLAFITSAPGLILSFSLGCVFQLRHNKAIKTMRTLVGFRWIRMLFAS
jgi:hypothetical protein